jgi:hypothetical protein
LCAASLDAGLGKVEIELGIEDQSSSIPPKTRPLTNWTSLLSCALTKLFPMNPSDNIAMMAWNNLRCRREPNDEPPERK